jgi:hypothetical protein
MDSEQRATAIERQVYHGLDHVGSWGSFDLNLNKQFFKIQVNYSVRVPYTIVQVLFSLTNRHRP